jgi:hypothetical protein
VRGAAASATATLLAAVSHTIGGGQPPSALLMLSTAVLLAPLAVLIVGRRMHLVGIAGSVAVTQVMFHVIFAITGQPPIAGIAFEAHQHGALTAAGHTLTAMPPSHAVHTDALMLFAHFCAAVITTVLLWRGELLLRAVVRWVRTVLRHRAPLLLSHTTFRTSPIEGLPAGPLSRVLLSDVCRRGPPSLSCG